MRHLRSVHDVESKTAALSLLRRAEVLKRRRRERRLAPTLAGRVVALLFERESTRTRLSFEAGTAMLGASAIAMQSRDTQLSTGEPFRDAARVIGRYVDCLVVRTFEHATVEEYARHAHIPVVNGLSDLDHPCQVLTDVFTVYERRENPFDRAWAWVGPATPVANGLVAAAALFGFELRLALPGASGLDEGYLERARRDGARVLVVDNAREAVQGADVISTGAWPDSADRGALAAFQVNAALLSEAADDHFLLHSLPANRGEEVTDDVLEGRHSLAFEQAGNRLCVQQAVLEWLLDVPEID